MERIDLDSGRDLGDRLAYMAKATILTCNKYIRFNFQLLIRCTKVKAYYNPCFIVHLLFSPAIEKFHARLCASQSHQEIPKRKNCKIPKILIGTISHSYADGLIALVK